MKKIAKALTAGVAAGATAVGTAAADGSITGYEWFGIAGAVILAGYAVYRVPNAPATTGAHAETDYRGDVA